jgi:hypothetical protein
VSEQEAGDIITPLPAYVIQLNQPHAVVSRKGKTEILNEEYDAMGTYIGVSYSTPSDFVLKYRNQTIKRGKREISIADAWLEHPRRRQYERVIFEPEVPSEPGSYNKWRGFAVEPERGDCEHYYRTSLRIFAKGTRLTMIISWLGWLMSSNAHNPGVAIVLRGRQEPESPSPVKSSENCSGLILSRFPNSDTC